MGMSKNVKIQKILEPLGISSTSVLQYTVCLLHAPPLTPWSWWLLGVPKVDHTNNNQALMHKLVHRCY